MKPKEINEPLERIIGHPAHVVVNSLEKTGRHIHLGQVAFYARVATIRVIRRMLAAFDVWACAKMVHHISLSAN